MQKDDNKISFFKRVIISAKDFERYEDFALETTGKSIQYLIILVLIFSIIVYGLFLYKFGISDEQGLEFFRKNILNLEYEDYQVGMIKIEQIEEIILQVKHTAVIPIWLFILYLSNTIIDALILGLLGIVVSFMAKMKIKFVALFRMGIHALTLPILLNMIYMIVNSLTGFRIEAFSWMYVTISYIYMIVAILMIRTDIINRQMELIRIQQEQELVREQIQRQEENNEDENKENKKDKDKKENKKKQEGEDNNIDEEPQGSEV